MANVPDDSKEYFSQENLPEPLPPELNIVPSPTGSQVEEGVLSSPNFVHNKSGWVVRSDGTAEFSEIIVRPQTYTFDSNGTFVLPTSNRLIYVECWGGGGSGGAVNAIGDGSSATTGGGGGEYKSAFYFTSILTGDVAVTVGAGGTARTTTGRDRLDGVTGGTTSFGSYLTAGGGTGGSATIVTGASVATANQVVGGTGGTTSFVAVQNEDGGTSGASSTNGASCAHSEAVGSDTTNSGAGGGSANGNNPCSSGFSSVGGTSVNGGNGGAGSNTTATVGSAPGGGGGGASSRDTDVTSGAGGSGRCRVTVF